MPIDPNTPPIDLNKPIQNFLILRNRGAVLATGTAEPAYLIPGDGLYADDPVLVALLQGYAAGDGTTLDQIAARMCTWASVREYAVLSSLERDAGILMMSHVLTALLLLMAIVPGLIAYVLVRRWRKRRHKAQFVRWAIAEGYLPAKEDK